jgi:hypothetical protein
MLRENTSMAESGYCRGAAIHSSIRNVSAYLFYSYRKDDPSGYEPGEHGIETFTSVNESGYHRTTSELERRGILATTMYGGILSYRNHRLMGGLTAYRTAYSMKRIHGSRAYDILDFTGTSQTIIGGFLELFYRKSVAYLEVNGTLNNKLSFVAGWQANVTPALKLSIDIRHFPAGLHYGIYARGTGPTGHLANETGILVGCDLGLPGYWSLTLAMDYSSNPWFSYDNSFSNNRYALHMRMQRNTDSYSILISYTYRQAGTAKHEEFYYTDPSQMYNKHHIDIQLIKTFGEYLRLKTRLGCLQTQEGPPGVSTGSVLQQEVLYNIPGTPLRCTLGGFIFNTDDYASRIYVYEPNVLYSSGSVMLYDRGLRAYFLLRWSPWRWLDLWFKSGIIIYDDKVKMGSGWDEVEGNKKSSVSFQIRCRM